MILRYFDDFILYLLGRNVEEPTRDRQLDSVKIVLIFLMVLGHVQNYCLAGINQGFHHFIYAFHMPLFIFLSGYFSKTNNSGKVVKQVLFLFLTVFVFQLLYKRTLDVTCFYQPYWILWYIYSLALWKLIVFFGVSNLNRSVALWGSFVLGILAGFLPIGYDFSLSRTLVFLPLMTLGYLTQPRHVEQLHRIRPLYAVSVLVFFLIFFLYFWDLPFLKLLKGAFCYADSDFSIKMAVLLRVCFYVISILLGGCILILIPVLPSFLLLMGRNSMFIYLIHGFFVFLLNKVGLLSYDADMNVVIAILYTIMIVAFSELLRRVLLYVYCNLIRNE